MTIRVAVLGAGGRMGATVCRVVAEDPELDLAGGVDPVRAGDDLADVAGLAPTIEAGTAEASEGGASRTGEGTGGPAGLTVAAAPDELPAVDVVVDFTHIDAARSNLAWAAAAGIHAVVGTSGFAEADYAQLRAEFTQSNCVVAPNFAIGAVLMMRFAELAAPWFPTAEIVELHHDGKLDAPSGTAVRTAERMAAASDDWADDPTRTHSLPGARGAEGPGGIHVHAVRLRGLVAHQEVMLGTTGETLTIRHDSYERSSFMPGVVLAVKQVADRPGVTIGLDPLLGL